jgi:anaerobic dimethyl sulfoxide reductase subunit C (anchor subunit)
MEAREWALIAFTILAQMAVGAFLVLGVVYYFVKRKAGTEEADRMSDRALLAIGPVMILGLIASLFHLGDIITAYRAVTNLGTSWLSREILFGVLFAVLGGLYALMQWRKISTSTVRNVIGWIAALVGLALVYSMSMVYMLPTQLAWNTLATPFSFFTTTLLLGALAMGAAYVANYGFVKSREPECADVQCDLLRSTMRWIAIASIILVGVEFIIVTLNSMYLSSSAMVVEEHGILVGLRMVLAFLGAGVFGIFLYQNALSPGQEKVMGNLAYAAFVVVLVAEVLGRFLFYSSQVQIGI